MRVSTGRVSLSSDPVLFFFHDTAPTEIYTLSLHDALPICGRRSPTWPRSTKKSADSGTTGGGPRRRSRPDRKSTRLNSSHVAISYAVFCLKKKKTSRHGAQ